MAEATWNSLEVAKLIVAGLTPVLVALVGFWLNGRLKSLEQAQWAQQKVIERRIKVYDDLAIPLNELFCFFCYVGTWKEMYPPDVVRLKRDLDRTAHTSAPLFDEQFLDRYAALIDLCFATFGGWGADAQLRTFPDRREEAAGEDWNSDWDACFADRSEVSEMDDVAQAYKELMAYLAGAIGVAEVDAHMLGTTTLPANVA